MNTIAQRALLVTELWSERILYTNKNQLHARLRVSILIFYACVFNILPELRHWICYE